MNQTGTIDPLSRGCGLQSGDTTRWVEIANRRRCNANYTGRMGIKRWLGPLRQTRKMDFTDEQIEDGADSVRDARQTS